MIGRVQLISTLGTCCLWLMRFKFFSTKHGVVLFQEVVANKKEDGAKKQTKLGMETRKEDNYSEWYSQVSGGGHRRTST